MQAGSNNGIAYAHSTFCYACSSNYNKDASPSGKVADALRWGIPRTTEDPNTTRVAKLRELTCRVLFQMYLLAFQ